MKWIFASLALVAMTASAAEPKATYKVDGNYGSLGYVATVNRKEDGQSVIFHIDQLNLTFDPGADVNSTTEIASPSVRIITSKLGVAGGKATVTYEALVRTDVLLDSKHRNVVLKNITFSVPKVALANSNYAGLAVIDGKLLWPMYKNLHN